MTMNFKILNKYSPETTTTPEDAAKFATSSRQQKRAALVANNFTRVSPILRRSSKPDGRNTFPIPELRRARRALARAYAAGAWRKMG